MTKSEFNDLFDLLSYGHDADLSVDGQRYFLEWNGDGITIYKMQSDAGHKIAMLCGENKAQVVDDLFNFSFLTGKSLNSSYQEISILDIE